ncbi:conserved exported protein of unknown function (plasmid) [Vibrio harveyi]|uniref:hypothetical protein n=1 Tax=Vibrio harveyi TaxID=669 RepID=UPI0002DF3E41|nr:hypothetical protein [Vibrio harveyi]ELY1990134.1 hypothetical protein [Vibrio harveyi]MCG9237403.1 hypothetical protein [Vibrio harveyi]MCG9590019.1 hypothetical protein [Vibrio harveyi]CAH1237695.1 conserved exported protein of unknown function [Vibrio harveyi]CAH1587001.1 conserved exported protein of unknown function [Vibrio harveyi]
MKKTLSILLLSALSSWHVQAAQRLPEVDTLQVSVRTIYPPELSTVAQAVDWLIEPLGYYVITEYPAPDSAKTLLTQPIPPVAKMHRTMPVLHALQLLIGEDNTIIVDKKNRLITFSRGH